MGAKRLSNAGLCWQLGALRAGTWLTGNSRPGWKGGLTYISSCEQEVMSKEKGDQEDNGGNMLSISLGRELSRLRGKNDGYLFLSTYGGSRTELGRGFLLIPFAPHHKPVKLLLLYYHHFTNRETETREYKQ